MSKPTNRQKDISRVLRDKSRLQRDQLKAKKPEPLVDTNSGRTKIWGAKNNWKDSDSPASCESGESYSDREIVSTRLIDAPRERVFQAVIDPKQVVK